MFEQFPELGATRSQLQLPLISRGCSLPWFTPLELGPRPDYEISYSLFLVVIAGSVVMRQFKMVVRGGKQA